MRLDKIDLNLFVVLDAVYRERNVTRVAQRLHLSQPAVSNALGRLRQTFDDQLFVRTPGGMQPTPVADNVIGDVRKALGLLHDSVGVNARFDPRTSRKTFRLGMNDLAQLMILPVLQRRLAELAPGASVSVYYIDRDTSTEELKSSALDLLLESPQINARELSQHPLVQFEYVVAMRPEHSLASGPLSMEDYLQARHVHVSGRRRGRGQADVALHTLGQQRDIAIRVQNYSVAAAITAANDLLWTVPAQMASTTDLHVAELPFQCAPLELNLYWPRGATDDPASCWIRKLLTEELKKGLSL